MKEKVRKAFSFIWSYNIDQDIPKDQRKMKCSEICSSISGQKGRGTHVKTNSVQAVGRQIQHLGSSAGKGFLGEE